MRVLLVKANMDLESGGSVRAVLDICEVARRGNDRCDIAAVGERRAGLSGPSTAPSPRLFPPSFPSRFGTSWAMFRWLMRNVRDYDLVELHEVFTVTAVGTALVCRVRGVPYIIRPHGSLDPFDLKKHGLPKRLLGPLLRRAILARATGFCLTSTLERERLVTFGSTAVPRHVVPLPVRPLPEVGDRQRFRDEVRADDDTLVVLFMSRIDYKKGLPRLISAVRRLRDSGRDVRIALCGTGEPSYLAEMRRLISDEGLTDVTHLLGFVQAQQKADALAGADAFVLPSDNENFGIAVVEAMYAGLPVIISENVYISSLLKAAGTAMVIDATEDGVVTALTSLMDDPRSAAERASRAAELAAREFSPEAVTAQEWRMRRAVLTEQGARRVGRVGRR